MTVVGEEESPETNRSESAELRTTDRSKVAVDRRLLKHEVEREVEREVGRRVHASRKGGRTLDTWSEVAGAPTRARGAQGPRHEQLARPPSNVRNSSKRLGVVDEMNAWGNRGRFGSRPQKA